MGGAALTPQGFVAKWRGVRQSERAVAQQHFLDLCALFGQRPPAEADPLGEWFTFEKGVEKTGGGRGFADVWKRGHFAWEYKGRHKDLGAAYQQLLLYREPLENPPLLVVCDVERYEVHTNFTGTPKHLYRFTNEQLTEPEPLRVLRALFDDPEALRPGVGVAQVTEEAARRFAGLARALRPAMPPPGVLRAELPRVVPQRPRPAGPAVLPGRRAAPPLPRRLAVHGPLSTPPRA